MIQFNSAGAMLATDPQAAPTFQGMMLTEGSALSTNILITFDKLLLAGTGNIVIRENGVIVFNEPMGSARITLLNNTITLDPVVDLKYSKFYSVELPAGIVTDSSGNLFQGVANQLFRSINSPTSVNLSGTDGNDTMQGSDANDTLAGAGGDDYLTGFAGNDLLDGGEGSDGLYDDGGDNTLIGGAGNDYLSAFGSGSNSLLGGVGNDYLGAYSTGNNFLTGGDGNDYLTGGSGNDTLDGGMGDDSITIQRSAHGGSIHASGGDGADTFTILVNDAATAVMLSGGAGSDLYQVDSAASLTVTDFASGEGGDVMNLNALLGIDRLSPPNPFGADGFFRLTEHNGSTTLAWDRDGAAGTTYAMVTLATLTGVAKSSLVNANFGLTQYSVTGDPTGLAFSGSAGDDRLIGSRLNDTLAGGDGSDFLSGDMGDDLLDGGEGNDRLVDSFGTNILSGGGGDDYLETNSGNNRLLGGTGHDYLVAHLGNATLEGGSGDDVLQVVQRLSYYDTLHDQAWSTAYDLPLMAIPSLMVLDGGEGTDLIKISFSSGVQGSIRASGGAGSDTFHISGEPGTGTYEITDFATGAGGDLLNLLNYNSYMGSGLNPLDPAAQLMRFVQLGADTVLQYNMARPGLTPDYKNYLVLKNVAPSSLTKDNFTGQLSPDGAHPGVQLSGSDAADNFTGTAFNDTLSGGAGADRLSGGDGNDQLNGGDGNDILLGGYGRNTLIGGPGVDTAVFDITGYWGSPIRKVDGNWTVSNEGMFLYELRSVDTLIGVERGKFPTYSWAFDTDGTGGAVYRLYHAAFDRTPDKIGLGFWMAQVDRGTLSLADVSAEFVKSPEFAALYGSNPTNTELVTRFYQNMLDREPDATGKAFWINVLDEKLASVATVLSHFSDSAENQTNVAQIIGNGFEYIPYGGG